MRDSYASALAKGKGDAKCNKFETPGTCNCSEIPLWRSIIIRFCCCLSKGKHIKYKSVGTKAGMKP